MTILLAACGALVGLLIVALAHSGSGFETGPMVFLALSVSSVSAVISGVVLLVGKRGAIARCLAAFSTAMLLSLVLIPLFWPYPPPDGPQPLSNDQGRKERK